MAENLAGSRERWRPAWLIVLLSLAFASTALLAWEAWDAAPSREALPERVLRDYSGLAAREFLRRARSDVAYFALYSALRSFADAQRGGGPLPDPAALAAGDRNLASSSGLFRHVYRVDLSSSEVEFSPAAPSELAEWARRHLSDLIRETAPSTGELAVTPIEVGGIPRTFVYGISPAFRRSVALGFEIDVRALLPFFRKAAEVEPLLPASLAPSGVGFSPIAISISDRWGRELYASGARVDPRLAASVPAETSAHGMLAGMRVQASVPASSAETFLVGGRAASRAPALAVSLVVAGGLLVAAVTQLARERRLARLRSDFVAGVSHELRTPLAQIRLFAETLLLGRIRSKEEERRSIAIIEQEARRLTHLVENTLTFSRIERCALRVELETRDVAEIACRMAESLRALAAASGSEVAVEAADPSIARVDSDAVRQVLINLVDNAAKYGPPGQRITVMVGTRAGRVEVAVVDEGPGIPPGERARVFERFVRLERDRGTHRGGAGIGLAVVRELVALQGGSVAIESQTGGGARVVLSLPEANVTVEAASAAASERA